MFSRSKKKKVYVIDIFGVIEAASSSISLSKKNTDMQKVIKTLHRIAGKDREEAVGVIIHLNTPGGTTGTSEETAMMIEKVRSKGIPVVASMADICCSGGYWIASACDYIFANRTSMTGSIGVIMQLPNLNGLSDKLGVKQVTVKAGRMKDLGNPFRELTEEEREFLQEHAEETHEIFKEAVRSNRREIPSDVPEIFDGRPFSADFALHNHLIDEIGTFYDALDYLLKKAGVEEKDIKLQYNAEKKGLLSRLFSLEAGSFLVDWQQIGILGRNGIGGLFNGGAAGKNSFF